MPFLVLLVPAHLICPLLDKINKHTADIKGNPPDEKHASCVLKSHISSSSKITQFLYIITISTHLIVVLKIVEPCELRQMVINNDRRKEKRITKKSAGKLKEFVFEECWINGDKERGAYREGGKLDGLIKWRDDRSKKTITCDLVGVGTSRVTKIKLKGAAISRVLSQQRICTWGQHELIFTEPYKQNWSLAGKNRMGNNELKGGILK